MKSIIIKIINWCLVKIYTIKGWSRKRKFKINHHYYGGVNKTYGIYMGDGEFFETMQYDCGMGVVYMDSKRRKYNNLQLGLFKWTECGEINVELE